MDPRYQVWHAILIDFISNQDIGARNQGLNRELFALWKIYSIERLVIHLFDMFYDP